MFTDMRLLWPALGATMAVLVCLSVAIGVLKSTSSERPSSLATRLEAMNPGSEANPLRPDNNARVDRYFDKFVDSDRAGGISIPRVMDDGASVAGIPGEEAMFTMAMVVNREGRITTAEMLNSERGGAQRRARAPRQRGSARRGEAVAIRAGSDADWPHGRRQYGVVDFRDHGADARSADARPGCSSGCAHATAAAGRPRGAAASRTSVVPRSAPHRRPEAAGSGISPLALAVLLRASVARNVTPRATASPSSTSSNCSKRESAIPSFG